MAPRKCCVGGCNATSDSHRLYNVPKDDKLRNLWMSFLVPTNPLLIGLSKEQLLEKRVCHRHFDRHQLDEQGRRMQYGYPCLFSAKEIAHGIPLSSEQFHALAEHNYGKLHEDNDDDHAEVSLVIEQAGDEHSYVSCSSAPINKESTTLALETEGDEHSYASCSSAPVNKEPTTPALETEAMAALLIVPSGSHGETFKKMVVPISTKRKASSIIKKLDSKKRKYIREAKSISTESLGLSGLQRLNEAQKLSENQTFFKNFDSLSKQAKTLLTMQLKLVRKNKMARRFNMEEKLLALTLMKQSPKAYKLLEKMFALPTKRTLHRLSEKICFEPGINPKVIKYVKEVTKTWERKKKLCTITFDEVALSPHLTYNEAKDVIDGFVELGDKRKLQYCDHALVFMIRGICSPWRQSLAYYFCEGTVSATELVVILKTVVSEVAQAGLQPLGLVCDQGSTFRTALKIIRQDTIRSRDAQGIRDCKY